MWGRRSARRARWGGAVGAIGGLAHLLDGSHADWEDAEGRRYDIDITARIGLAAAEGDVDDRLLTALETGTTGPAVGQDLGLGTIGAAFTLGAGDAAAAFDVARAVFLGALREVDLFGVELIELHVTEVPTAMATR